MIAYRRARPEDADAVAHLFARVFTDTFGHLYRSDDLADFLSGKTAARFGREIGDPEFDFFLAEDADRLAGFLKLGPPELPIDTPPETIELCQLYIDKPWHGAGIATALMDQALARAAERGARHMQLSVFVDNHRARRFYERYGFEQVGRYDFMVGNHADEDIILRHVLRADR